MVVLSSLLFGSHVKVQRQKADGKQKDYELANYIRLHEIIDFAYFAATSSTNLSTFKSLMTKLNNFNHY